MENVGKIVTAAGFSNFEALEKFRWKQDSGYVFKAVRSNSQDVFEVKHGNTIKSVGQANKPIVNLLSERKITFHHNAHATVPATMLDTQEDDDDKTMEAPDAISSS